MVEFYAQMNGIAGKLLNKFKQGNVSLIQMVKGTGPAHNPGPSTRVVTPLSATATSAYSVQGGTKNYGPNTLIQQGDLKVVAKVVQSIEPNLSDKIDIDGKEYSIIKFNRIPDPGVTVAWVFFVRR